MLQDIKNSDGLETLLLFIFTTPEKTYKHRSNDVLKQAPAPKSLGKRALKTALILISIILVLSQLSNAQEQRQQVLAQARSSCQTTDNTVDLLFYLQRIPGTNKVGYELNFNPDGTLQRSNPVNAFWISKDGHRKLNALTEREKRLGYGLKSKPIGNEEFEIRLMGYSKIPLYLKKSEADNRYRIYIQDEEKELLLKRIFIKLNHGTFWFPKLQYLDLTTTKLNIETKLQH